MRFFTGQCINSSCKKFGHNVEVQADGAESDILIDAECASCHSRMRRIFTAPNISTSKTRERRRPSQPSEEPKQCEECASSDSCTVRGLSETFERSCEKRGLKPVYLAGSVSSDGEVIGIGVARPNEELN
ncbi:MAG: hypothetical protein ABIA92_06115 [Patescibacteria group bacterium]